MKVCVGPRGNSGYQAINLALHLGADRIVLLGYDMKWRGQQAHYFGSHPRKYPEGHPQFSENAKQNGTRMGDHDPSQFVEDFRTIKPAEYGIEIYNCTRDTALDAFPRVQLEDML